MTGAHNIREKDLVPVALDGSSLAGGVKIKKGKLRGVESNGMLCSGEELGINEDWYEGADVNGILLLHGDPAPGTDIRPVVGLDDYVLDIAVTANRPDCQSVYGIAREVAALLGKPLRPLALDYTPADVSTAQQVTVTVEAPDLCPRYIAHYVSDLNDAPTPLWMRAASRCAGCALSATSSTSRTSSCSKWGSPCTRSIFRTWRANRSSCAGQGRARRSSPSTKRNSRSRPRTSSSATRKSPSRSRGSWAG